MFDRIQLYLRLQKIAKQNPKYYSKLSAGPFAWKAINDSWGQKVKPSSKFFPNPDDEIAKKELRAQENFSLIVSWAAHFHNLAINERFHDDNSFVKFADELNRDILDLEAELEAAEMANEMAGGDSGEVAEIAEMEAAEQAEASMENI